jgi:quercetin dioxygenase-like cupin family protein
MLEIPVRLARNSLLAATLLGTTAAALAQSVPHSLVASPDIYKVIAENDQYRVIEVTWKPGQRDQFHSHPASAVYYPMNCTVRGHLPSGASADRTVKAGTANVQGPIPSHSVENTGQADCKMIMFEPK